MQTIEQRIAELMQGKYNPYDPCNLAEALANLELEKATTIANFLHFGQYDMAGAYIDTIVREHWRKLAGTQADCDAQRELADACPRCKGASCSSCEDREFPRRDNNG